MHPIDVTVGICTWNRAALLRQTLTSLRTLRVPGGRRWELLIVDNNSTDDTPRVIQAFEAVLPLRSVFEPNAGLSQARNRLISECRGRLLLCVDDDVLVEEDALAALLEAAAGFPDAVVFGGPIRPWFQRPPDPDLAAAFPELARGFCGLDHQRPEGELPATCAIFGANMAFRVCAIEDQRFDTRLGFTRDRLVGGEETDFIARMRRQGGKVVWIPRMTVHHYVDPDRGTLSYLTRHSAGQGQASVRLNARPEGLLLFGVPRWLWRRCAETYCHYLFHRALNSRTRAWTHLREHWYWRGVLTECLRGQP